MHTGLMHGKEELSPSNDMNMNKFVCTAQLKGELSPRTRLWPTTAASSVTERTSFHLFIHTGLMHGKGELTTTDDNQGLVRYSGLFCNGKKTGQGAPCTLLNTCTCCSPLLYYIHYYIHSYTYVATHMLLSLHIHDYRGVRVGELRQLLRFVAQQFHPGQWPLQVGWEWLLLDTLYLLVMHMFFAGGAKRM